MSFDFNETYYLNSKLAQLKALDASTYNGWTTAMVKQAIENAGMTVEGHYHQYSVIEGTSANPYFNTTEYLEAKVNQLNSKAEDGRTNWTVEQVIKAFQDAGFTSAEDHYTMYGCRETDGNGKLINPSNAFDANAYVEAKLAQLQATDPVTWSGKTALDVANAIADAGMTPVDHFEDYGKAESAASGIDMVQTVPVVERVSNDPIRDAMGENVPSNYNPSTAAPATVTGATATEVTKPCDMGDAATAKPADPVKVPGDSGYVAPPANVADTNESPVVLVEAAVTNDKGTVLASASEFGKATSTTEGNVTTTTVKPLNEDGTVNESADPIQTTTTNAATGATTTETKLEDANGNTLEVKEETTKAADGSTTTTTTATETNAAGKTVASTTTTSGTDANGNSTGSTSTYTDASGAEHTTETDANGNQSSDGGNGGSGGGGSSSSDSDGGSSSSFYADLNGDTVHFSGTAKGDITVEGTSTLSFKRGGTPASSTVDATVLKNDGGLESLSDNYEGSFSDLNAIEAKFATDQALKLNDTTLAVSDILTAEGFTTGAMDASSVTSTEGTGANVKTMLTKIDGGTLKMSGSEAITVSDAAAFTAAELTALTGATTGNVTLSGASALSGTLSALNTALRDGVTATSATATLEDSSEVLATDLSALDAKIGTVTASSVTAIRGTSTEVLKLDGGQVTVGTSTNIILNDKAGDSVAATDLTKIAGLAGTSGTTSFANADVKITGVGASTIGDLNTASVTTTNAVAVVDAGLTAANLVTISPLVKTVDASAVTALTGAVTDYTTASTGLLALNNITYAQSTAVTVTGTDALTLDNIAALKTIAGKGTVTVNDAATISGDLDAVSTALEGVTAATAAVTLTDTGSLAAKDLNTLDASVGTVTASSAGTLTGLSTDVKAVTAVLKTDVNITLDDAEGAGVAKADLATIGSLTTTGTVTFTNDGVKITGASASDLTTLNKTNHVTMTNAVAEITDEEIAAADLITASALATIDQASGALRIKTLNGQTEVKATQAADTFQVANTDTGFSVTDFKTSGADTFALTGGAATEVLFKTTDAELEAVTDGTAGWAVVRENGGATATLYYDADGNWSSGKVAVGTIGLESTATLTTADFSVTPD